MSAAALLTDALQDLQAAHDLTHDHVLAVALGGGRQGDEELAGVAVLAGVGHADDAGAVVLQLQRHLLVVELAAIDAVAAAAVPCRVLSWFKG